MTMKKEVEIQYKKGLWTVEEDKLLIDYVELHGKGQWNKIAKKTEQNRKRVDSCQSSKQAAIDPTYGKSSMEITAVDIQSSQKQQAETELLLNSTTHQESVTNDKSYIMNPFLIPHGDLELITLTMMEYLNEYSSFDLA
ncbi:hypothetical protein COLO4_28983 [Corchorus olitorius]|uniref:Uncharacterized protein n=1 Tax=Corchorus olitorius TaxID=93759 RepID=A0A1R3HH57_9ROSI|nr:hypothetical protein COLO4_28983 [Corchorus olitorius]